MKRAVDVMPVVCILHLSA